MPVFTDQTGRLIDIPAPPRRIVSLVPSQTELLATLGLDNEVAGITRFCVHPNAWYRSKQRIGGTKDIKIDLIRALQPDLILANREENVREQVEALWQDFPVWVSDVHDLPTAIDMIRCVGAITGKDKEADTLCAEIETGFARLLPNPHPVKAAYLIWQEPFMTVGGDTFIHQMLGYAGFENVFGERRRYPAVTLDDIRNSGCQVLLLSSEPYPFGTKHAQELAAQLPGISCRVVDGERFSWYGSRLQHSAAYLDQLRKETEASLT